LKPLGQALRVDFTPSPYWQSIDFAQLGRGAFRLVAMRRIRAELPAQIPVPTKDLYYLV
jgi:hypothetical protein